MTVRQNNPFSGGNMNIPEVCFPDKLRGTNWEVECGHIDSSILDGNYALAADLLRDMDQDCCAWVIYDGLRCAIKHDNAEQMAHYRKFVTYLLEN
jgi:hypothetical protein